MEFRVFGRKEGWMLLGSGLILSRTHQKLRHKLHVVLYSQEKKKKKERENVSYTSLPYF